MKRNTKRRTAEQTSALRAKILKCVSEGRPSKAIAIETGISRSYVERILPLLGCRRVLLTEEEQRLIQAKRKEAK